MADALARDDQPALQSLLLVCRRAVCADDYSALVAAALSSRRAAALAAAAAAPETGGAAGARASARCWLQLAAAVKAVNAGAPLGVLQAHVDLLTGLAAEWRIGDQEAVRDQRAELVPIIKACIREQQAAAHTCEARCARAGASGCGCAALHTSCPNTQPCTANDHPPSQPPKSKHIMKSACVWRRWTQPSARPRSAPSRATCSSSSTGAAPSCPSTTCAA